MSTHAGNSQDRAKAARILLEVIYRGKTLDQTFDQSNYNSLLRELVYGSLRHYYSLDKLVGERLTRSLRSKDLDLRCLMLVGAYQLHFMRIPAYAAINETVSGCRELRKPWAGGLVNAVLRGLSSDLKSPHLKTERSFELPDWMQRKIARQYDDADAIMAATVERAPMSLRVNALKLSPSDYREKLAGENIPCHPGWHPENLLLSAPMPARDLPGYREGLVSIQDAGALFASRLVTDAAPDGHILDACAAPGGKLFHIAEQSRGSTLVALELSDSRLLHLRAEAARLGHTDITFIHGDASQLDWYTGAAFDAILLDAPCSGSGTLRRHPDIKILRKEKDLARYAAAQKKMLENLWHILSPGGTLIYCTCSLFNEENDAVIDAHLQTTTDAEILPFELPVGHATRHGWQLVPLPSSSTPDKSVDGFYFARMTRRQKTR